MKRQKLLDVLVSKVEADKIEKRRAEDMEWMRDVYQLAGRIEALQEILEIVRNEPQETTK